MKHFCTAVKAFTLFTVGMLAAYPQSSSAQPHVTYPSSPGGWQWASRPWTGDDKPYANVESTIDTEIANHEPFGYFQKKYHERAQQNPADPLARFADAYAVWKQLNLFEGNFSKEQNVVLQADQELAGSPDSHSYHYERLRFLMEAKLNRYSAPLRSLGERLLAKDTTDWEVKYRLVPMLSSSSNDQALALRYISDLLSEQPDNANTYTTVGYFYWHRVYRTHSRSDAYKAIAAWRKYLQLAPADDSLRPWANHAIQDIQTEMAKGGS